MIWNAFGPNNYTGTQCWYFLSKANIWIVYCARATAFIFDTPTDVLVKVSKFLRQKMSRPEGARTPNLPIHAECSNHLSYQGQTFAVPWFWILTLSYRYFWSKVNIWNVSCARSIAFIFDTRTDVLVKVSKCLRHKLSRQPGFETHLALITIQVHYADIYNSTPFY